MEESLFFSATLGDSSIPTTSEAGTMVIDDVLGEWRAISLSNAG
jgi:hypothetical protein